jgi:uncharacterized protein
MSRLFVDSFYFFAILNPSDAAHAKAVEFSKHHAASLVTTTVVLIEVADGLARTVNRRAFQQIISSLRAVASNEIVSLSDDLFEKGVKLYDARPDKHWSLTDCVSFVVMAERGLQDALTGDHHYEQAGFTALLKL